MDMPVTYVSVTRPRSTRSALKSHIASFLCLVPAVYCASIVLFGLWHFADYGTALPQFLRYMVVPGLLALGFLGMALFGSRTNRVAIGGSGIAILIALFAFELRLEARWATALEGLIDIPSTEWMKKAGVSRGLPPAKTVTKLNQSLGVHRTRDAVLGGIPDEQVLLCRRGDQALTYRADRFGFRNPAAVYDRQAEWMLIGDSFVEGICLPGSSDFVGRTREISGRNVVGLGIRGAGPLLELAMLERFGPVIRPRIVIFAFYEGNDWENLQNEVRIDWLRDALAAVPDAGPAVLPQGTLRAAHDAIASWVANDAPDASKFLRDTNLVRNTLALHQTWTQLGLGYPAVPPKMPVYAQILGKARELARTWGGQVVLLYVPQSGRLTGLLPDYFVYDQLRDRVLEAARSSGVPFIDLTPEFLGHRERAGFYADDGHFSERGAALAAETLHRALQPEGTPQ